METQKFLIFLAITSLILFISPGQSAALVKQNGQLPLGIDVVAPLVTLTAGKLKGAVGKTIGEGKTYFAYRGIPYGKPPVGDLRFAPPVPSDPWNGTLDATNDRSECTQIPTRLDLAYDHIDVLGSEDCLFINVYTTDISEQLPVMVWIHGGTFGTGSSRYELYRPDYILDKDVVFVSFNYRLGVFGFLSTEDLVAPGNWGLKDQILALQWIKENISKFGGNPKKVTIFGEDSGAISISYLLQSKLADGLYRGAIVQSGSSLCQWAVIRDARERFNAIASALGIDAIQSDTKTIITELRKIDYKQMKFAESHITLTLFSSDNILSLFAFGAVKEPEHNGAIFTEKSYQLLLQGEYNKIPIIIGHNSFEGAVTQHYANIIKPLLISFASKELLAPVNLSPLQDNRKQASFDIVKKFFNGNIILATKEQIGNYLSAESFTRPIIKTAQLMSVKTKVYYYVLSYQGNLGYPNGTFQGVTHGEDLQYLFVSNNTANPSDILTRNRIVTLWTNFVKTLDPTPTNGDSVLGNFNWVPNTWSTDPDNLKYLNIDKALKMKSSPDRDNWLFFEHDIYGIYGNLNYHDTY